MNKQHEYPIIRLLGKIFFPTAAPWERRKNTIIMLWTLFVGLSLGCIILAVAFMMNAKR